MKLVVFFTRGVSLRQWVELGLFDREKLIYEGILASGQCSKIWWVTYGTNDAQLCRDLIAQGRLSPGIEVLPMPRWFASKAGVWLWSVFAACAFRNVIRQSDVIKTNQMDGAWTAAIASILFRKPLYVRTGYTWSLFERGSGWRSALRSKFACACERLMYRVATVAAVSSVADMDVLNSKHQGLARRLFLLPNYIDTTVFRPAPEDNRKNRLLFVGRLNAQKNLEVLIRAAHAARLPLDIVGRGEEESYLKHVAESLQAEVCFMGRLPNASLPDLMRGYRYFALVSHYEGMPKALLEAMACGCICVGTNVAGIREVVSDGITGVLAPAVDFESVRKALERAAFVCQESVGGAASRYIAEQFSLQYVLGIEGDILRRAKAGI